MRNAAIVAMATGCSTNAVVHLIAMARRAGVDLTLDDLDALGRATPLIANVRPSGKDYLMEDFFYAGGLRALMKQIEERLDTSAITVTGKTLGENLEGAKVYNDDVIRPLSNPVYHEGSLAVLRGNLAPSGAVIKPAACDPKYWTHEGPALVFDSYPEMKKAVDDETLDVTADTVMVLRNAGPQGGPGFPEWGMLPIPKALIKQGHRDMLRISDARMSGTSYGACVLHVAPESLHRRAAGAAQDRRHRPARPAEPPARHAGRRGRARASPRRVAGARAALSSAAGATCSSAMSGRPTKAATSTSSPAPSAGRRRAVDLLRRTRHGTRPRQPPSPASPASSSPPTTRRARSRRSELAPILDRALGAGVHMPVVNGNTGEFYALTTDEACTMVREVAGLVADRAPLLAGVGRGIRDACRLARASADAGAAALMIHQPPDPFVAPRGTVDYVKAVSDASGGLPIMLYLRNDAIGTAGIADALRPAGRQGRQVGDAEPDAARRGDRAPAIPAITWVGGLAEVWAPTFYAVGARGFTCGLINVWPERSMAIHAALEASDYAKARDLIAGMRAFEDIRAEELNGTNVTGVKAALQALGQDCGPTRPPSAWPLTEAQQARMRDFLTSNGLIGQADLIANRLI